VITKGAPDVLLERCNKYYYNGQEEILKDLKKDKLNNINMQMAKKALRVIAIAYKDIDFLPNNITTETIEKDLTFMRTNWHD
jgi:Ca2+-transporting ATPase